MILLVGTSLLILALLTIIIIFEVVENRKLKKQLQQRNKNLYDFRPPKRSLVIAVESLNTELTLYEITAAEMETVRAKGSTDEEIVKASLQDMYWITQALRPDEIHQLADVALKLSEYKFLGGSHDK